MSSTTYTSTLSNACAGAQHHLCSPRICSCQCFCHTQTSNDCASSRHYACALPSDDCKCFCHRQRRAPSLPPVSAMKTTPQRRAWSKRWYDADIEHARKCARERGARWRKANALRFAALLLASRVRCGRVTRSTWLPHPPRRIKPARKSAYWMMRQPPHTRRQRQAEQHKVRWHRRRARLLSATVTDCTATIAVLRLARFCHWCCVRMTTPTKHSALPTDRTIDHVVPLTRGGAHSRDNIVAACNFCQLSRRNKLISIEWQWQPR